MIKKGTDIVVDSCVESSSSPTAYRTGVMLPARIEMDSSDDLHLLFISVDGGPSRFIWKQFIELLDIVEIEHSQMQGERHFVVYGTNARKKHILGRFQTFEIAHQKFPTARKGWSP